MCQWSCLCATPEYLGWKTTLLVQTMACMRCLHFSHDVMTPGMCTLTGLLLTCSIKPSELQVLSQYVSKPSPVVMTSWKLPPPGIMGSTCWMWGTMMSSRKGPSMANISCKARPGVSKSLLS